MSELIQYPAKFKGAALASDFSAVIKLELGHVPPELEEAGGGTVYVTFQPAQTSFDDVAAEGEEPAEEQTTIDEQLAEGYEETAEWETVDPVTGEVTEQATQVDPDTGETLPDFSEMFEENEDEGIPA